MRSGKLDNLCYNVGSSAIADLMVQGFVRNKREAADALDIPGKLGFGTEGAGVYWYDGDSEKREKAIDGQDHTGLEIADHKQ